MVLTYCSCQSFYRLLGAESTESLDGRSVTSASAVPLVTVPDASTPSGAQLKNVTNPSKKIKVENTGTEGRDLLHPAVYSETECEQATSSSPMDDSHAHVAPTPSKRICWTLEMVSWTFMYVFYTCKLFSWLNLICHLV